MIWQGVTLMAVAALGFLAFSFRSGGQRWMARWYFEPYAPLPVRNLPYVVLGGAIWMFVVFVFLIAASISAPIPVPILTVTTVVLLGLGMLGVAIAVVPPDRLKPAWLRDEESRRMPPAPAPPAERAPSPLAALAAGADPAAVVGPGAGNGLPWVSAWGRRPADAPDEAVTAPLALAPAAADAAPTVVDPPLAAEASPPRPPDGQHDAITDPARDGRDQPDEAEPALDDAPPVAADAVWQQPLVAAAGGGAVPASAGAHLPWLRSLSAPNGSAGHADAASEAVAPVPEPAASDADDAMRRAGWG